MTTINFRVVDLYQGDRVTSFQTAASSGLLGVIHKATTGATGTDKKYAERRKAAVDAGLLWGAYHWGTAAPVAAQVENFIGAAAPDGNTLVALDFETTKNNQMTLAQAQEFLALINQRLNRKAIIYSGNLLKEQLGNKVDPFFGSHRLWLAHYNPNPVCQKSWSKPWLWQYTDNPNSPALQPSSIPGIPGDDRGNLDCDSYDGSAEKLKAEWAS